LSRTAARGERDPGGPPSAPASEWGEPCGPSAEEAFVAWRDDASPEAVGDAVPAEKHQDRDALEDKNVPDQLVRDAGQTNIVRVPFVHAAEGASVLMATFCSRDTASP
jgi:hypothetical protein